MIVDFIAATRVYLLSNFSVNTADFSPSIMTACELFSGTKLIFSP